MGKIIGGIAAAVVVIIAIAATVLYFNLDKIIIAAVEGYGSDVTKGDVTLAEVDIDMTSGRGGMKGLVVGNPEGFTEPFAFELGEISLEINIAETSAEMIHITSILVDAPKVTYELAEGTNNLDAIKKNVDDFIAANGGGSSSDSSAEDSEGPKIIIDSLVIQNGRVAVKAPVALNKKIEGSLPKIVMKDIGKEEGGASPGEVAAKIVQQISGGAMNVISGLGVGKTLKSLSGSLTGAADSITKGVSGGGTSDAVEGAAGKIKGLLK